MTSRRRKDQDDSIEAGRWVERERLRPLLESCERILSLGAANMLEEMRATIAALRAELGKETS